MVVKIAGINFPFSVPLAKRIIKYARNAKALKLVKDLQQLILVEVKPVVVLVQRQLNHQVLAEQDVQETLIFKHSTTCRPTNTLETAFKKLVEFSPIPSIKLLHKNQVIAPASAYMNDFNPDLERINAKDWMMYG